MRFASLPDREECIPAQAVPMHALRRIRALGLDDVDEDVRSFSGGTVDQEFHSQRQAVSVVSLVRSPFATLSTSSAATA